MKNKQSKKQVNANENIRDEESVLVGELRLKLSAFCFQHTPSDLTCSATYLRNAAGVISGAEYTGDSHDPSPALFIFDQLQKIKIRLHFFIENVDGANSRDMNLRINHKFFINSVTQKISINGEAGSTCTLDIEIPKDDINFNNKSLCTYLDKLTIELSDPDEAFVTVFDRSIKLYLLANKPTGQISLINGDEKNYPMVEFIDMLRNGGDISDYTKISNNLYNSNILSFNHNSTLYSTRKTEIIDEFRISYINIDIKSLLNDINIKKTNLAVASEVYAIALLYGFWLCGQTANIAFSRAVYEHFDLNNPEHSIVLNIHLECAGSTHSPVHTAKVSYHATVIDPKNVYDGSVRMQKSIINPNMPQPDNVTWSNYKSIVLDSLLNHEIIDGVIQDGYCHTFNSDEAFLIVHQSQDVL